MVVVVAEHTSAVADPAAEVVPAAVHMAAETVAVVVPVAVHKQPAEVEAGSEHIPAEPAAAVVPVAVHKQPAEVEAESEHIPAFAAVPAAVPKSAVAAAVPVHHLLLLRILNRISHYLQSVIRTVYKTYKPPLFTKKTTGRIYFEYNITAYFRKRLYGIGVLFLFPFLS